MDNETKQYIKGLMVGASTQDLINRVQDRMRAREFHLVRYKRIGDQTTKRAIDEIDSVIGLYETEIARRNNG